MYIMYSAKHYDNNQQSIEYAMADDPELTDNPYDLNFQYAGVIMQGQQGVAEENWTNHGSVGYD